MVNHESLRAEAWSAVDQAARASSNEELSSVARRLEEIERRLRDASQPEMNDVLSAVVSQRITVAHELGQVDEVVARTAIYLQEFGTDLVDQITVVLFRLDALHETGAHEEELVLASQHATLVPTTDLLAFIEPIVTRHSGEWQWTPELVAKTVEALADLRPYPPNSNARQAWNGVVEAAVQAARDMNRRRTEQNLRPR